MYHICCNFKHKKGYFYGLHMVYCTDHIPYCTDHIPYCTDHIPYCTVPILYFTDNIHFCTVLTIFYSVVYRPYSVLIVRPYPLLYFTNNLSFYLHYTFYNTLQNWPKVIAKYLQFISIRPTDIKRLIQTK